MNLINFHLKVNWTWIILALLIVWTLATGYFPSYDTGYSPITYWIMAIAAAAGIFISIVFHEICHLMMARKLGLGGNKITLFIFGGASDMEREPTNPKAEFWIAAVGPVFSGLFGFMIALVDAFGISQQWPTAITDTLYYLSTFNYIVAMFNMVPAFPLDGGRILRSIIWAWKKNIKAATKIACDLGVGFGLFLTALGILELLSLNLFNGIWLFFLGMFLVAMARASYTQLLITKLLAHEPVEHVMKPDTFSVSPDISLKELADDVYKHHAKLFPVMEGTKLVGCVGVRELRSVPELQWSRHKVREYTAMCTTENVVKPDDDIIRALSILQRSNIDELIVAENGKLVGKISTRDITEFFRLKMELEEGA